MTYAIRFSIVAACLLVSPLPLSAHHGAFYKKVHRALKKGDLNSIKELFSESAWKGKDGGMSAAELHKRLKKRKVTGLSENQSYDRRRSRCYVYVALQHPHTPDSEEGIYLLAKYVGGIGNINPKAWQIVRMVNDRDEAHSFLSRTLSARVFPMQVGQKWVYAWGDKEVVFEVLRTEKTSGTKVFVVRRTIGESSLDFKLAIEKDGVYIHHEGKKKFEPPLRQFAFDARRKEPWKWRGTFAGKPRTEQFENLELDEITVPGGTYFTIGVRQSNPETGDQTTFWLADGVGIVKLAGKSEFLADDPKAGKVVFEWRLKRFENRKK